MARRKVSVELELQAAQFNADAKGASATVKEVKNQVQDLDKAALLAQKGVAQLGDKTERTAADMVVLKSEIKRVEAELRDLAREYEKTADAAVLSAFRQKTAELNRMNSVQRTIDKLDAAAKDTKPAQSLGILKTEIQKVENELKKLAVEYQRTGSVAAATSLRQRQSVLQDLRALEIEAKKLTSLAASGVPDLGSSAAKGGLETLISKPALIGAAVKAATALTPILGAMVGGAVTGAVGLGGIIGGIAAASSDPRVKAAAHEFGLSFGAQFKADGKVMVDPVLDALGILRTDLAQLHLDDTFRIAAPFVTQIAHGIGGLAKDFMPGFNRALQNAAPVMHEISIDLPKVGKAFGDMLDEISQGKGNVEGINTLFNLLDGTLVHLGHGIKVASDLYNSWMGDFIAGGAFGVFLGLQEDWRAEIQHIGEEAPRVLQSFKTSVGQMTESAQGLADAIDAADKKLGNFINTELGIDDVNIQIARGWEKILGLVKENGTTLDLNREAGRRNRETILDQVSAYGRLRDLTVDQTHDIFGADRAYDSNLKKLEAKLIKEGLSAKAVHAMIDPLFRIPSDITTNLHVKVHIDVTNNAQLQELLFGRETAPKHAAGGPNAPGWNIYGEQGPELHWNDAPGYTMTAAQSKPFLSGAAPALPWSGGAGSAAATPVVNVSVRVDPIDGRLRQVLITDAKGRGIPEATVRGAYP